jgi:hypothetical protein
MDDVLLSGESYPMEDINFKEILELYFSRHWCGD